MSPPRVALGLAAATLLAHHQAPWGTFHFDDAHALEQNPALTSSANLHRFFTDASTFSVLPQNQNYRPILLASYAATTTTVGLLAGPLLAGNLIIHLLMVLLVWRVLRHIEQILGREASDGPAWAALAFAVHPLNSQVVHYVSARSESLSSLLALTAVWAGLKARRDVRFTWLACGVLLLSLLTKVTVATTPLLLLAIEASAADRRPWPEVARRIGPLVATAMLGAAGAVLMTPALARSSASDMTSLQYLRSELAAVFYYPFKFLAPVGLSADPLLSRTASFLEPRAFVAMAWHVALLGCATVFIARRRSTAAALAIVWVYLALAPSSSFAPLAELVNEHRPYLAMVGFCTLAVLAARSVFGAAAPAVGACIALGLACLSIQRSFDWRSETSLWRSVVTTDPQSARAQMNLGVALMSAGNRAQAAGHLREAARLGPGYAYARINWGNWLLDAGETEAAVGEFDAALSLAPNLFWAPYYRGLASRRLNAPASEQATWFAAAVKLSPNFVEAHAALALAAAHADDLATALASAQQAVRLRGSFADRFMLAFVLQRLGRHAEALPVLELLAREQPADERVAHDLHLARSQLRPASAPQTR
jgi:protein O-mannosyl-transferase